MNSNFGKSGSSLGNFDFDLGIGSNRSSQSLNDQKKKPNPNPSSYSVSASNTTPSWNPNKPSWTPQPAPPPRSEIGGPTSMVGDIFGRSWSSAAPSGPAASVGVAAKDPGLFGDLVSSALGHNKAGGGSTVPLKNAAPAKASFSMEALSASLPKGGSEARTTGSESSWGSSEMFGDIVGASGAGGGYSVDGMNKSSNVGGSRSIGGGGIGTGTTGDPFGSLFDLGAKTSGAGSLNSATKAKPLSSGDWDFGDFHSASKSNPVGLNPAPSQPSGSDAFDMLFPTASGSGGGAKATPDQSGYQQSFGGDDWGFESGLGGGGNEMGNTTELEGLPPPPAGVSASSAKNKGLDNYKQGQFADAIKWLSWAVVLLEKSGNAVDSTEVLTCRAYCYKEVGEYKKAVADCTKVLDKDGENVSVLVQRALLYESIEKYKLGAEDLRTVMKLDPGNRVARSTIHRLTKMID